MFPSALGKIIGTIDRMSDVVAHLVKYLILVLIFVLIYEVAARYIFNKPTVWALETSMMVFWAYRRTLLGLYAENRRPRARRCFLYDAFK